MEEYPHISICMPIFERNNFTQIIISNITNFDYPKDKLISTMTIDTLIVKNENGIEVKGIGNQISGMDSDVYEVTLLGVPYPFYEEEFPHHVKAYNEMFKE